MIPRRAALALISAGLPLGVIRSQRAEPAPLPARPTPFGELVERLSEPGGYFDTDNLISNETSYLHVVGAMQRTGVRGGAYVGVGPDQNFSYIAAIRPEVAFIVDVRRDNLLHHLLFKALFAESRNRLEFLCRLLGRPIPEDVASWSNRSIDDLVNYIDRSRLTPADERAMRERVLRDVSDFGVTLSAHDRETIARFHATFIKEGLGLRFASFNRAPMPYYPTLRQLVLEKDLDGARRNYLATEGDFQFVKGLEGADKVIPVVGDFAGRTAIRAVAKELERRGLQLSALYVSNVEFYLWRDGGFDAFARNVQALPRAPSAVVIRSYFGGGYGQRHPDAVGNYHSVQLLQNLDTFVARSRSGGWHSYWELVTERNIPLR